jgi:hypothetical protein
MFDLEVMPAGDRPHAGQAVDVVDGRSPPSMGSGR